MNFLTKYLKTFFDVVKSLTERGFQHHTLSHFIKTKKNIFISCTLEFNSYARFTKVTECIYIKDLNDPDRCTNLKLSQASPAGFIFSHSTGLPIQKSIKTGLARAKIS